MNDDRTPCRAAGAEGHLNPPPEPVIAMASGEAALSFDPAELMAMVEDNAELLEAVVTIFKREAPQVLHKLKDAVTRGDVRAVEHAAHKLKGSVLNLYAQRASEIAGQMEDHASAGSLADAATQVALLEAELNKLTVELDAQVRKITA